MTVGEVLSVVERDMDYYRNSGGGVTFSGGEAFLQPEALFALLSEAKGRGIHTAIETSGQVDGRQLKKAEPLTDLFLFDIKHCREDILRKTTGADLKLILENLRLIAGSGKVIARIPCIPGFNVDEEALRGIFSIICDNAIREVHLLPYHTLGIDKYERLGRKYSWSRESLPKENLKCYAELARSLGLIVRVGG